MVVYLVLIALVSARIMDTRGVSSADEHSATEIRHPTQEGDVGTSLMSQGAPCVSCAKMTEVDECWQKEGTDGEMVKREEGDCDGKYYTADRFTCVWYQHFNPNQQKETWNGCMKSNHPIMAKGSKFSSVKDFEKKYEKCC